MPALVDDEMLETFAVFGRHREIAGKLVERYAGVLDEVGFSTVVESEADAEALRAMIRTVQAG